MQMTPGPQPADAGDRRVFRMPVAHRVLASVVLGAMTVAGVATVARQMVDDQSLFVPLIVFLSFIAFVWWHALMVQPIGVSVFTDGHLELRSVLRTHHLHVRDVSSVQLRNQRVTIGMSRRSVSPIVADPRELALALLAANPTIRTLGPLIVPVDPERERANRRFARWFWVPWSVGLVGGLGVSAAQGTERVGKWIFLGGWLVLMAMMAIAARRER